MQPHQEKILVALGAFVGSQSMERNLRNFWVTLAKFNPCLQPHLDSLTLHPYECPNYTVCQYVRNFNTTPTLFANSKSTLYTYSDVIWNKLRDSYHYCPVKTR
jgi:hypothetical protein